VSLVRMLTRGVNGAGLVAASGGTHWQVGYATPRSCHQEELLRVPGLPSLPFWEQPLGKHYHRVNREINRSPSLIVALAARSLASLVRCPPSNSLDSPRWVIACSQTTD
jgi:hypothetical protein